MIRNGDRIECFDDGMVHNGDRIVRNEDGIECFDDRIVHNEDRMKHNDNRFENNGYRIELIDHRIEHFSAVVFLPNTHVEKHQQRQINVGTNNCRLL